MSNLEAWLTLDEVDADAVVSVHAAWEEGGFENPLMAELLAVSAVRLVPLVRAVDAWIEAEAAWDAFAPEQDEDELEVRLRAVDAAARGLIECRLRMQGESVPTEEVRDGL